MDARHCSNPIPGRLVTELTVRGAIGTTPSQVLPILDKTRVDAELPEVTVDPVSATSVSRSNSRYLVTADFPTGGEDDIHSDYDSEGSPPSSRVVTPMHPPIRQDGGFLRSNSVWQVPLETVSVGPPLKMVRFAPSHRSHDKTSSGDPSRPSVVAPVQESLPREEIWDHPLDPGHHGHQSSWLGGSTPGTSVLRTMVATGSPSSHQCSGAKSNCEHTTRSGRAPTRSCGSNPVRQRHGRGVCQSLRKNQKQGRNGRSKTHSSMGGTPRTCHISNFHSGSRQLGGRLPQSTRPTKRGMGSPSRGISPTDSSVGSSGSRPHGVQTQQKVGKIRGQDQRSSSHSGGCVVHSMGLRLRVPVSSTTTPSTGPQE